MIMILKKRSGATIGCIYVIKNTVNNKVYVGQTVKTMNERWDEHLYNAKPDGREQLIYLAMRKYGVEKFHVELVKMADGTESLDELEIYYIDKFNSLTPGGYNMTRGGSKFKDDNPMYHEEIRKKVSKHFVGDKNPAKRPEVKEKIRQKALGRKASDEARAKMSANNPRQWLGKHLSEETRTKISQNHGCRGKFGGLNPNSKKVQRLDKNTFEVLEEYDAVMTACRWVRENVKENARASNISQAIHGKQKTAFGFAWKLVE